jgi:3-oxoacyl-[acyl-carrier protein] reductase
LRESAEALGAVAILANVTSEADVQRCFAEAIDAFGHVDVLLNNAGLGGTAPLLEMTDEQWNAVLDVTLTGTMRMTRAAFRHMIPRKSGAIVNNASVVGWRAQEGQAHYAAAKAGVMALTRCAAVEAAHHNVRVNAVAPSLAMHPHLAKVTTEELLAELTTQEAFGRAAEPWEVANVIVFLASDLASYMTGEVVAVSSQHP